MHRHGGFKGLWVLENGLLCTGMGVLRDFWSRVLTFVRRHGGFKEL